MVETPPNDATLMAAWDGGTHVWVSADLLNDVFIKVTRVSKQAAGDVVCVLQAQEDIVNHGSLTPLLELGLAALGVQVEVLDPIVVLGGKLGGDMLLELDNIAVRDLLGVDGGDNGSSVAVDRLLFEDR